jgi:hypothetical protein
VHLVDVTNPYKLKTLDIYQLPADAGGHVVKYNKETNMAAVASYFLDVKGGWCCGVLCCAVPGSQLYWPVQLS